MTEYRVTGESLEDVADAIRTKGGTSASLEFPNGFVSAIQNIPAGGYDMPKFVATFDQQTGLPTNITCDKTFAEVVEYMDDANYYSLVEFVVENQPETRTGFCGSMYPVYSGNQIVAVNNYIETSVEGVAVYEILMASDGTLTYEQEPIPLRDNTDLTASNLTVTVPNGYYESNATKTLTDQNLIASNIKKDVSIFGVTGTYEGGGGASNIVIGSFKGTTAGAAMNVTIPYSGNGYPVIGMIYPKNGTNKSGDPFATLIQNKAEVTFNFVKQDPTATPDFTSSTADENKYLVAYTFKYSTSDPLVYSAGKSESCQLCTRFAATATSSTCVRFTSSTNMSVYIANDNNGFANGIDYEYLIKYSS